MKKNLLLLKRFIITFKIKAFSHMTAVSKNVYFDILDDIVNIYNNTLHRIIKTKPVDFKPDFHAE